MTERSARSAIWGGRFTGDVGALMDEINVSIDVDKTLAAQDLMGSRAHVDMLEATGIIGADDAAAIRSGLDTVAKEIDDGTFPFRRELEDIHMNVEGRLRELVGEPAGRLHTARSRNDQVATDFKLWVRDALDTLDVDFTELQRALVDRAGQHAATVMPGFTHLQPAQPVTFGHHLMAYVEMFARDRGRLADARRRMNECPLGAAALAGTAFPINREMTAEALYFDSAARNSLDAVSARDFALEALTAAAIAATHLSRFAEELVVWCSAPFSFIRLSDAFTTGSSIMPQKRNPDAAELVRAKAGRIIGALNALLVVIKGVPLAYSKDMQEDKPPVFDALPALSLSVRATAGMVRDMTVNEDAMRRLAGRGHTTATDLADWLVRALGLPFREAHHITGQAVLAAERSGRELAELSLADLKQVDGRITKDALSVLTVERSVASRVSFGGTAPQRVTEEVERWRGLLDATS